MLALQALQLYSSIRFCVLDLVVWGFIGSGFTVFLGAFWGFWVLGFLHITQIFLEILATGLR